MKIPWELDVRTWDRWDWLYAGALFVMFLGFAAAVLHG
jgi:hypothetical protein